MRSFKLKGESYKPKAEGEEQWQATRCKLQAQAYSEKLVAVYIEPLACSLKLST